MFEIHEYEVSAGLDTYEIQCFQSLDCSDRKCPELHSTYTCHTVWNSRGAVVSYPILGIGGVYIAAEYMGVPLRRYSGFLMAALIAILQLPKVLGGNI